MASVRFTELQSRPMEFLDFTSVTLDEFQQLVPPFETAFECPMGAWRMDGKPRTARRFTVYKRKRNKKVAVKLLLPVLTVLHLDLCSPTHHWPSSLGFVRHDARLHGSIASFSCVCVWHSSVSQYVIQPLDSSLLLDSGVLRSRVVRAG